MNIRCVCTEGVFNDCGTELNDRRIIDTLGDLCFLCALLLSLELALNGVDNLADVGVGVYLAYGSGDSCLCCNDSINI